jgi:hypothetical protein
MVALFILPLSSEDSRQRIPRFSLGRRGLDGWKGVC